MPVDEKSRFRSTPTRPFRPRPGTVPGRGQDFAAGGSSMTVSYHFQTGNRQLLSHCGEGRGSMTKLLAACAALVGALMLATAGGAAPNTASADGNYSLFTNTLISFSAKST